MSARALRSALEARGIRLALVGGRVRVAAPAGVLTAADRAALREERDALLALVEADVRTAADETPVAAILTGSRAAAAITRALAPDGRGGIVVTSRVLNGRRFLFVRDEQVSVPERYRDLVRFTAAELEQIGRERWSADRLRAVVMAKDGLRTAEHPDEQARLVPADQAAEMRRTMVPAREWLERSAEGGIPAGSSPSRVGPSIDGLCEERQPWLWRGFTGPSPEEP